MNRIVICPYCNQKARLVNGRKIHPNKPHLGYLQYYLCQPCDAYIGTYSKGKLKGEPLGRLATAELRAAKTQAHAVFNKLWDTHNGRTNAYEWLANLLGIPKDDCHISKLDIDQCLRVIELSEQKAADGPRFG